MNGTTSHKTRGRPATPPEMRPRRPPKCRAPRRRKSPIFRGKTPCVQWPEHAPGRPPPTPKGPKMTRKNTKFVPAKSSAKDTREGIDAIIRIVRRFGWSYEEWRYVSKRVLAKTDIHPERTGRKLPRVLTAAEFTRFYEAIDKAKDPQHA